MLKEGQNIQFSTDNQIQDLQRRNAELGDELESLRNQYNEAIELTGSMSSLHKTITSLTQDLHESNLQKDDLNQRLEIALQKNDQLQNQLNEINKSDRSTDQELNFKFSLNKKEKEINQQLTNEIESLKKQLSFELKKSEKNQKLHENLLSVSSSFFQSSFSNLESLISFLGENSLSELSKSSSSITVSETMDSSNLSQNDKIKLQKTMQQLKAAIKARDIAEENALKMDSQFNILRSQTENQILGLENKIQEIEKTSQRNELQYRQDLEAKNDTIKSYSTIIQKLKNKNSSLKEKITNNSINSEEVLDDSENLKLQQFQEDIKTRDRKIADLQLQNNNISDQLHSIEKARDILKKKNESLQEENSTLESQIDEYRKKNTDLELQKQTLQEKLCSNETQFSGTKNPNYQAKDITNDSNSFLSRERTTLTLLQEEIDKQRKELNSMYNERQHLLLLLHKQSTLLAKVNQLIQKEKKYSFDLETKLNEGLPKTFDTSPTNIPATSWFLPQFPKELIDSIGKYANDDEISETSKLRHILLEIFNYYTKQINDLQKNNDEEEIKENNAKKYIQYIQGELISVLNFCFEIENKKDFQNVISIIKNLKENQEKSRKDKEQNDKLIQQLFSQLSANDLKDAVGKSISMKNKMNDLEDTIKQQKDKFKKQLKQFKAITTTNEMNIVQLNKDKTGLEQRVTQSAGQIFALTQHETELETQISQLKNQISKLIRENEEKVDDLNDQHDEEIQKLFDSSKNEKQQYQKRIEELNKEKVHLQNELSTTQDEVIQWKNLSESLKNGKLQSEKELFILQQENEDKEKLFKDKLMNERHQLREQYQGVIEELKIKNNELRAITEKATSALKISEQEKKDLMNEKGRLQIQYNQAKQSKDSAQQELDREKHLLEVKIQTAKLACQMEYEGKFDEERLTAEKDKRLFLSAIANQFRELFNPRQPLTENSVIEILKAAHNELNLLRESDRGARQLLGINPNDSLEKSIQKLLMSLYKPK